MNWAFQHKFSMCVCVCVRARWPVLAVFHCEVVAAESHKLKSCLCNVPVLALKLCSTLKLNSITPNAGF